VTVPVVVPMTVGAEGLVRLQVRWLGCDDLGAVAWVRKDWFRGIGTVALILTNT
jgi:hypothetical protein